MLNFALNLEYLEANFYQVAVNGAPLSSSDTGGGAGTVSGGSKVSFSDATLAKIAAEIAQDELLHVRFLRTALGNAAVAQPNINLSALGIGFANKIPPSPSDQCVRKNFAASSGPSTRCSSDNPLAAT